MSINCEQAHFQVDSELIILVGGVRNRRNQTKQLCTLSIKFTWLVVEQIYENVLLDKTFASRNMVRLTHLEA